MKPKYSSIVIDFDLSGPGGNAFFILGRVKNGFDKNGVTDKEWEEFHKDATSGDYNHLLNTCRKWVTVSDDDVDDDYDPDSEDVIYSY